MAFVRGENSSRELNRFYAVYHTSREINLMVVWVAFCRILGLLNGKHKKLILSPSFTISVFQPAFRCLSNKYCILNIIFMWRFHCRRMKFCLLANWNSQTQVSCLNFCCLQVLTFNSSAKPCVATQKHSCGCDEFIKLAFLNCCHATYSFKNTRT